MVANTEGDLDGASLKQAPPGLQRCGPRTQCPAPGHLPGHDRCQRVADLPEGWEVEGRRGGEVTVPPALLPITPTELAQGDFGDARS